MTVCRATPEAMRNYVSAIDTKREDAYEARSALLRAYEAFAIELPGGFRAPARPDIAGPLGRTRDVDTYVGVVADRFEEAGASGENGEFTMDSALLAVIPYEAQYDERRRERLRERAETELARIREHIDRGLVDETTAGELIATLGWMRFEIEHSSDPRATAADLIDSMGPGDLHEALDLLESHARDIEGLSEESWPIRGIQDLSYVVSMGLEGDKSRAARWARDLADRHGDDGLALLSAYTAPGTQTFGVELFKPLLLDSHLNPDNHEQAGEIVEQVFGTNSLVVPALRHAVEEPVLANGLVHELLELNPTGPAPFDSLFSNGDVINESTPPTLLGNVLEAAVHPDLNPTVRAFTAAELTSHYVETYNDDRNPLQDRVAWPDEVTRGFAAATQPLFEAWQPQTGELVVNIGTPDEITLAPGIGRDLWEAVGLYGENSGGVEGLTTSIQGATTTSLTTAAEIAEQTRGSDNPLDQPSLERLNNLYVEIDRAVGSERFASLVEAVESGDRTAAVTAVMEEAIAELPGGATVNQVMDVARSSADSEVTGGGNPLASTTSQLFYEITLIEVAADGDLADSPAVQAALAEAARHPDGEIVGLHDLILGTNRHVPGQPIDEDLTTLRDRVLAQINVIDPELAQSNSAGTSTDRPR